MPTGLHDYHSIAVSTRYEKGMCGGYARYINVPFEGGFLHDEQSGGVSSSCDAVDFGSGVSLLSVPGSASAVLTDGHSIEIKFSALHAQRQQKPWK